MNDADLLSLIGMGGDTSQLEAQMQQQMNRAKQIRQSTPQLQSGRVGRVPYSPSPLAQIANVGQQFMAGQADKKANDLQMQMVQNKQQQMAMLMRMLQQQPPQDPTQQSGAQGPGMVPPNPMMSNGNGMMPPPGAF